MGEGSFLFLTLFSFAQGLPAPRSVETGTLLLGLEEQSEEGERGGVGGTRRLMRAKRRRKGEQGGSCGPGPCLQSPGWCRQVLSELTL